MSNYHIGGVGRSERFEDCEDEELEEWAAPRNRRMSRADERDIYCEFRRQMKRDRAGVVPGWFACGLALLGIFSIGAVFIPFAAIFCFIGLLTSLLAFNSRGFFINVFAVILTALGFILSPSAWLAAASVIVALHLN